MSVCCTRRNAAHKSAFVKSSYLRWILGDLHFNGSLPRPDYIHLLIEHFRESSSPESMRRVTFHPDTFIREYVNASCHLPGAYVEFFPCPHCTHTEEEDDDYEAHFVEVFHIANVHDPNVCATVTFTRTAFIIAQQPNEPTGFWIEVEFTRGCPNAPIVVDHRPRVALHIHTDGFIEVLRFLTRSELETALLVSRRWSNVIGWAEGTLQQRRSFFVSIKFYGESSGMLSVTFRRREREGRWPILRVLTTRGLSQALYAVRSHFRNAFVEAVIPIFFTSVEPPGPPREMLVDIPLPLRVNWLMSLLHSMPLNSVIDCWSVHDVNVEFDNFLPLVRCVPKTHRKLGCVRELELDLSDRDATWAQLVSLLNQPSIRRFNDITVLTKVTIDSPELLTILSSRQSPRLHLVALSEIEPHWALLTLPEQLIQDFVALPDVSSFVAEFSLRFAGRNDIVIPEMPATNRRKRFRFSYHLLGVDTVARVHVYANRAARECLTVVTFDHFRRTVRFFKGNVSPADLKLTFRHIYAYY